MGTQVNSLSGALGEGLQVTVVGLAIVFAVLIILMLVLMAMKAIFYKGAKKPAAEASAVKDTPVKEDKTAPQPDDEELVAVLTAAVAASLNTSTYNLRIKSYRRTGNNAPAWNKAGLEENINSRF